MAVTILEALQNAEINLINNRAIGLARELGKSQLHNAITLLEKGYDPGDLVDPLLEAYPNLEDAPRKSTDDCEESVS